MVLVRAVGLFVRACGMVCSGLSFDGFGSLHFSVCVFDCVGFVFLLELGWVAGEWPWLVN